MGNINVYSGPMKSGKTQEILNEYKRQLIAGRSVQMFKPLIDTRNGDCIAVRNGINIPAMLIKRIADLKKYDVDAYFIDEFQFLKGDVSVIQEMADNGKKFFISGLNLTSEKKPFGKMPELLAIADNIKLLTSICDNCKCDEAIYTYYKAGNKDSEIIIGDQEYGALCRSCYQELTNQNLNSIVINK